CSGRGMVAIPYVASDEPGPATLLLVDRDVLPGILDRAFPGARLEGNRVRAPFEGPLVCYLHLLDVERELRPKGAEKALHPRPNHVLADHGLEVGRHLHAIIRERVHPTGDVAGSDGGDVRC